MIDRVFQLKKLLIMIVLLIIVILKILLPANRDLAGEAMSFFGLEESKVQTLGRSLRESSS